jgi:hypothetical protein
MRDASTSLKVVWQYLRYVPAAADKHSFRQAAADFGVWESTISRGIRELEDEVGVALSPKWRRACVTNLVIRAGAMVFTTPGVKVSRRLRTRLRDNARTRCSRSAIAANSDRMSRPSAQLVDYLFHRDRPTFRPTLVRAAVSRG